MRTTWAAILLLLVALSLSCGGGSSSSSVSNPGGNGGTVTPPTGNGGGSSSGSTTALAPPNAVVVNAGATASGIDITVPSGTPPLNAQVLGVAPVNTSGGSASNTGGVIQRGTSGDVLLFGKGLNGGLTVSILGPKDITIGNVQSIKSTSGLPGIEFTVDVDSGATPGARTVVLQDTNGNVTTFTGGLEIQ